MKPKPLLKSLSSKKIPKQDREQSVLLGVIELYLKTNKPIGSQTLQENGFPSLSSSTIRNYFSKMDAQGYLKQPHTSGGRIPTAKAFRLYADLHKQDYYVELEGAEAFEKFFQRQDGGKIAKALRKAAEVLSEQTHCAVFFSSPRFDQDFLQSLRLIALDAQQILCVLISDFGMIQTETIDLEESIEASFLRSVEEYFLWRMNKGEKPLFEEEWQTKLAQRIYNEVMVRHVVGYANFSQEDLFRTGLSKILMHPEFNDATALATSLSLLEDEPQMRAILEECSKRKELCYWIGEELKMFHHAHTECAVLAIPYWINQTPAGSIALLGPMRLPYRRLFGLMELFSKEVSRFLTQSVYKHKISFRTPTDPYALSPRTQNPVLPAAGSILLEDKSR